MGQRSIRGVIKIERTRERLRKSAGYESTSRVLTAQEIARLWRQYAPALQLLARTRCDIAEDCVQEAFVRLAAVDCTPSDPVAWLARVVRNEAISQHRRELRRRNREDTAARDRAPWFLSSDSAESSDAVASAAQIENSLKHLDEESREIVVAHVWTGLSFRQISEAFDISSSAVHRRYQSALKVLKEHLEVRHV